MSLIKSNKGIELSLQTVVIFIILLIVFIVLVYFFTTHYGTGSQDLWNIGGSAIDGTGSGEAFE